MDRGERGRGQRYAEQTRGRDRRFEPVRHLPGQHRHERPQRDADPEDAERRRPRAHAEHPGRLRRGIMARG
jgi:hypothetical protein